ncbi:MAG: S-layer homology domain-containing protein [Clostridiaceae bacterium]|nr:S-layer homology domain-containing protein [Clostridiaceae bacterium]
MNIYKSKVFLISAFFFIINITVANAHGAVYETQENGENKIRIIVKWSTDTENKGIALTHYYLENGKTLHIGYEEKNGSDSTAFLDYDLNNAIPPIRIILDNISKPGVAPFSDIKGIEAQEYIAHLHDAQIVNGRPDGTFEPQMPVTRAEFMTIMVKALKLEGTADNTGGFTDIEGHWAKNTLLIAAKKGFISGFEDRTLKPDKLITVGEVSSIISRAFEFKTSKNGLYGKLRNSKWYSSSVKKIFDTGILTVKDGIYKDFDEEKHISRADCAMMVSRALSTY